MPDAQTDTSASLREASARGFLWTLFRSLAAKLLSLLSFVVLARLLSPKDYGIAALGNIFVILLNMLTQAGFSQALIQKPEVEREDLDTVFWIGLAIGAVLAICLCIAAWPISSAFGEPVLRPILQVLSINFI